MTNIDFKVGSRVRWIAKWDKNYNPMKEGTVVGNRCGTYADLIGLNTDEPNSFNHTCNGLLPENSNGIFCCPEDIELISLPIVKAKSWSDGELDTLHSQYRRKSITEIANGLGRSYMSVQSKARHERIHKHPRREFNSRDCHFIIHSRVDKLPIGFIADSLHRSKSTLEGRISLMKSRNLM